MKSSTSFRNGTCVAVGVGVVVGGVGVVVVVVVVSVGVGVLAIVDAQLMPVMTRVNANANRRMLPVIFLMLSTFLNLFGFLYPHIITGLTGGGYPTWA
jgi:hypothetical protein